jgi:hypothetical protein
MQIRKRSQKNKRKQKSKIKRVETAGPEIGGLYVVVVVTCDMLKIKKKLG